MAIEQAVSFNLQNANCIEWDADALQYVYNDTSSSSPQVIQFPPSWNRQVLKLLQQSHMVAVITEKLPNDCINKTHTIVHNSYRVEEYRHIFRYMGEALNNLEDTLNDQDTEPFEILLKKLFYHCAKDWYRDIHQLKRSEIDARIILFEYYIMEICKNSSLYESTSCIRNLQKELNALPEYDIYN